MVVEGEAAIPVVPDKGDAWDELGNVAKAAAVNALEPELFLDITASKFALLLTDAAILVEASGRKLIPSRFLEFLFARVLHCSSELDEYGALRYIIAPSMHTSAETALAAAGFTPNDRTLVGMAVEIQQIFDANKALFIDDPTLQLTKQSTLMVGNDVTMDVPKWKQPELASRMIPFASLVDSDRTLRAFGDASLLFGPRGRSKAAWLLAAHSLLRHVGDVKDIDNDCAPSLLGGFLIDTRLPLALLQAPLTQAESLTELKDRARLMQFGLSDLIQRKIIRYLLVYPNLNKLTSGANADEAFSTLQLLAHAFIPSSKGNINSATINLLEVSVKETLQRVSQVTPIDGMTPAERTSAILQRHSENKTFADALPKAAKPQAINVLGLGASQSFACNSAQFGSLTSAYAPEVARFANSAAVTGAAAYRPLTVGELGFGTPGIVKLDEGGSGLNAMLQHHHLDPCSSLRIALNLGNALVTHFVFSTATLAGLPWSLLAALRPFIAEYFTTCLTTNDAGINEMAVKWHPSAKFILDVITGNISPESMDIQKNITNPMARARNPEIALPPVLSMFDQLFSVELEPTLTKIDRVLSFLGFERNNCHGLPAQIRAAMAEHYNHAAELRFAFRPALEDFIRQLFVDTGLMIQRFNCAPPDEPFPIPSGASPAAVLILTRNREVAATTTDFHHSPAQQLQRKMLSAQVTEQVAIATAKLQGATQGPQSPPGVPGAPPNFGKKKKAKTSPGAATTALLTAAQAATATATPPAPRLGGSTPLTQGSLARNVRIVGDDLYIKFEAKPTKPAADVTIKLSSIAAACDVPVSQCCWPAVWLKALSPKVSDSWSEAHCNCAGAPANVSGWGMHVVPIKLTQSLASSFR